MYLRVGHRGSMACARTSALRLHLQLTKCALHLYCTE